MKRILSTSEKAQIERLVNKVYVHTPEAGLREFVTQKLRRALANDPTILEPVLAYAVKVHQANQEEFFQIMYN